MLEDIENLQSYLMKAKLKVATLESALPELQVVPHVNQCKRVADEIAKYAIVFVAGAIAKMASSYFLGF